jgi:5-phospho-D-xylono-1,4-lactonase
VSGGNVRTVLGDVPADVLGVMFAHEHLLMTGDWAVMKEPDWRLDSCERAVDELQPAMASGLASVVEMTPLGFGRSPRGLREISQATGVHIVAATGFHKSVYYSDVHWIHRYTEDQIAGLLASEVTTGMDEHGLTGPFPEVCGTRAGVIKISTGYHCFGRGVQRLVACVAQAALQTGAPISTHNDKGTMGHELLDELERHGVLPDRVVLGHIDHNPDPGLLAELAARGAYLCLDMAGRTKYASDSQAVDLFAGLVSAGAAGRLLLGTDLARRSYWRSLGGGPGLAWTLDRFIPRLHAAGLAAEATRALTVNPQTAHTLRDPA